MMCTDGHDRDIDGYCWNGCPGCKTQEKIMPRAVYQCLGCQQSNSNIDDIWNCPECEAETCEKCFDRFAHCKKCGEGRADEELRRQANQLGWDFEE